MIEYKKWKEIYQPILDDKLLPKKFYCNLEEIELFKRNIGKGTIWTVVNTSLGGKKIINKFQRINYDYFIICNVPYDLNSISKIEVVFTKDKTTLDKRDLEHLDIFIATYKILHKNTGILYSLEKIKKYLKENYFL